MNELRPDLVRGMARLISAARELTLAPDRETITRIAVRATRELTGADGATVVLRDADQCFYADEDAIEPLWKGKRFPIDACVSGWSMLHAEAVRIEDVYADARTPAEAYRPTFVKSLAMIPIRTSAPVGAIGSYWAERRAFAEDELRLLQLLADSTSVALENLDVRRSLEESLRERTDQLAAANKELEAFSYAVSHDLRAPLRSIDGFSRALEEDLEAANVLDDETRGHVARVRAGAKKMGALIDDLLSLARVSRADMTLRSVDVTALARAVAAELVAAAGGGERPAAVVTVADGLVARADAALLRAALHALIGNALKFSSKVDSPRVDVGFEAGAFFVRDNGAGFDMAYEAKLFAPFQRLHSPADFPGTGVGLATVQRIVRRHGGRVWAESTAGSGATFRFVLPA